VPTDTEVAQLGRWWRQHKGQALDEVVNHTTLAVALSDVGILALGYLARRLTDRSTPAPVKDRIALSLGPRMLVQLHKGMPTEAHPDEGEDLLADYTTPA
jgi:hypothetical protein